MKKHFGHYAWYTALFLFLYSAPAMGAIGQGTTRTADTGQTLCYDNFQQITCPSSGSYTDMKWNFYGQDAQYSSQTNSYTKLNASGEETTSNNHVMVRDNVT